MLTFDGSLPTEQHGHVVGAANQLSLSMPLVRLQQAGAESEAWDAMLAVQRAANEDRDGFLVHSPYVLHVLRAG